MEKKEAQDLTKAIVSLVNVIKEQNKINDAYNKALRDNTDTLKDLRTRLGSVANAITSGGSVVNP